MPLGPEANKIIIYVACDAFVPIGYTELACLNGRPTDK